MKINIAILVPEGRARTLFITPAVIKALSDLGNISINKGEYDPKIMADMLKDAHVCITGWGCPTLDESILSSAKNLRLVAHTGGTVASLVSDFLWEKGIRVISGNNIFAESVAEGVLAYILAALRRIPFYSGEMQQGRWHMTPSPNAGLLDKKVGMVGFGAIPRYLTSMLKAFRVEMQAYDPYVDGTVFKAYGVTQAESLEALFCQCDIVSNHLPFTKDTHHLIGKDLLGRMRKGSLFVNTARGSTVDENYLAQILASGRINGILDVYEKEPLPMDNMLRGLSNVILMPHMAGPTLDRCERVGLALAEDINRMLNSRPDFCDNFDTMCEALQSCRKNALVHEISQEYAAKMTNDAIIQ